MKLHRISALLLATVLVMSYDFPIANVNASALPEAQEHNPVASSDKTAADPDEDSAHKQDPAQQSDPAPEKDSDALSDQDSAQRPGPTPEENPDKLSDSDSMQRPDSVSENVLCSSSDAAIPAALSDIQLPDEPPAFSASIEKLYSGYVVKGCFTEFLPDTISVQPQSSLDGQTWQDCDDKWDLDFLGDPDCLDPLQNQICLYASFEPLKSYLAGTVDHFYLRLSITRKNGITYETQAALIERGEPMTIPAEITYTTGFAPTMLFCKTKSPNGYIYCGKYQLTVSAAASPADIAALLPDTLPITVELYKEGEFFTDCTIDCPVTWKPLSLSGLAAGESVTLQDAAEEIVIPAGTPLCTPMGTFTLDEPLGIASEWWMSDEVVLVLNVIPDNEDPAGVLAGSIHGLEIAFDQKPTGATAIRVYTLTDGDSEWTELSGLSLLDAVNAQPATASSGYTTILSRDQEPFRSYLAAEYAGEEPTPFLVGLKIEGGVYNGCQLILPYPDTYDFPPDLRVGGAGGNQGNAGIGSRDDSTEEGQRPHLPQDPADETTEQSTVFSGEMDDSGHLTDNNGNAETDTPLVSTENAGNVQAGTSLIPADTEGNLQTDTSPDSTDNAGNRQINTSDISAGDHGNRQTDTSDISTDNHTIRLAAASDTSTDTIDHLQTDGTGNRQAQSSAITQARAGNAGKSPLKPLLSVAAASIACVYLSIMAAKMLTSIKSGRITIKKS